MKRGARAGEVRVNVIEFEGAPGTAGTSEVAAPAGGDGSS
jgi:hypothetical protein